MQHDAEGEVTPLILDITDAAQIGAAVDTYRRMSRRPD